MSEIHVHVVPTHEGRREPAGDRWCFGCRKRLPHDDVQHVPNDPISYYGPHWTRECSGCGNDRSDFPGPSW